MRVAKNGETLPRSSGGNYETARFNALRHGVLSRYTVLPWENAEEYQVLLEALVAEHRPQGPTEEHLVEELAGAMWRKRRLRLSESAAHHAAFIESARRYREATAAERELAEDREDIEREQQRLMEAFQLQDGTSSDAASNASVALDEYAQLVRKNELTLGPNELSSFRLEFEPPSERERRQALDGRPAIRAQAVAQPQQLESAARYEVHLDRRLERTLSTLLKLQQWRRENEHA